MALTHLTAPGAGGSNGHVRSCGTFQFPVIWVPSPVYPALMLVQAEAARFPLPEFSRSLKRRVLAVRSALPKSFHTHAVRPLSCAHDYLLGGLYSALKHKQWASGISMPRLCTPQRCTLPQRLTA